MNETPNRPKGVRPAKPEQITGTALDGAQTGAVYGMERISVRIVQYRRRLLDKDNLYGGTKPLTDGIAQAGLIPDDSEGEIELEITQVQLPRRTNRNRN